jgi:molybdopterin converting factor small subunit
LINVLVKYHAQARPAAGAAEERVALHETASIQDLLNKLADKHGQALRELLVTSEGQPHPSLLLFMHDHQVHAAARRKLADRDEIIVLPPMSGG